MRITHTAQLDIPPRTRLAQAATGIAMLAALGGGCFLVVAGVAGLIDSHVLLGAALLGVGVLVLLGGRWWVAEVLRPSTETLPWASVQGGP